MPSNNKVPTFKTLDDENHEVTQENFQKGKFIVYFYPKDNTPGCTLESCDFRDSYAQLVDKGFNVFGVSKDSIASHEKFKKGKELPFTLLSDKEGDICEAFDVWKQKSFMGKKYMGIERSTFIVVDGEIVKEWRNLKAKGHVAQVLETLNEMGLWN